MKASTHAQMGWSQLTSMQDTAASLTLWFESFINCKTCEARQSQHIYLWKSEIVVHIASVVGHIISRGGATHLQYADEAMIMVERLDLHSEPQVPSYKINYDNNKGCGHGYTFRKSNN